MSRRARRLWLVAGLFAPVGLFLLLTRPGSGLAYLDSAGAVGAGSEAGDAGEWIVYPHEPRVAGRPAARLEAVFDHVFALARDAPDARLGLRCLGDCDLRIDGEVQARSAGRKVLRAGLSLRAGAHALRVRVRRERGPPALALTIDDGSGRVLVRSAAGAAWPSQLNGATRLPARAASQRLAPPRAPPLPIPWSRVGALALFAALLWTLLRSAARHDGPGGRAERALAPMAAVLWLLLLWNGAATEPAYVGYDVEHHVAYLRMLFEQRALPLPGVGWQTYQPPLFYLVSAGWLALVGLAPDDAGAGLALRALTTAIGWAHIAGLAACVRLLLPGRRLAVPIAWLFGACLPLHIVLFRSFGNEALLAALSTAVMWQTLRLVRDAQPAAGTGGARSQLRVRRRFAALGLLLGAALLTKLSSLLLVGVVGGALALEAARGRARWRDVALALAVALLVSCPYYARIALHFGTPFATNWDPRFGFSWWQDPGYRVANDYLRAGAVLSQPAFAGFFGIWDGVHSTLFADGLASGAANRLLGPPWDYGAMRAAVALAIFPLLAAGLGLVLGLRRAWRRADTAVLACAALGLAMLCAFAWMTLSVPSFAQAKAAYASPALLVLVAAVAGGGDRLARSRAAGGALAGLFCIGLLTWAFVSLLALHVDEGAARTLRSRAEKRLAAGDADGALVLFEAATHMPGVLSNGPAAGQDDGSGDGPGDILSARPGGGPDADRHRRADADSPDDVRAAAAVVWPLTGRCRALGMRGEPDAALRDCEAALRRAPDDPDALFHTAHLLRRRDPLRAIRLLERLRAVAPRDARAPPALLRLALSAKPAPRRVLALRAARAWLRFEPARVDDPLVRRALGSDVRAPSPHAEGPRAGHWSAAAADTRLAAGAAVAQRAVPAAAGGSP